MNAPVTKKQRLSRSRRAFLKTVGGSATALPFYRLLEASAVYGATGDQPQRFIGMYAPHGVSQPFYDRRPGETETSFSFNFPNSVLSPFDDAAGQGKSFKDKVTTIEGIDLAAGIEKSTNGHKAACVLLTGSAPVGESPQNASLDQYLAVTKGLGSKTRFTSLVLGVGSKNTDSGFNLSYSDGGAPLPKIIDPSETFKMLFADLVVGTDPAAMADAQKKLARGKSVLDFLRKDIGRLQPRLAAPEKVKLDQHLTSLRELEKQLDGIGTGGGGGAGCKQPPMPNPADYPKLEIYNGGEPYLDKIGALQIDMLAQAMACDLTRFATLFIALTEEIHNNVAHQYGGPRGTNEPGTPATWLPLADVNRKFFSQLVRLMKGLDSFGILDSTLIYMSSDMGDPALHSLRNVPTILAGGANGKIKMGRRMAVEQDCPPTNFYCKPPKLTSNNKVLVSIAQAFGATEVTSFGTADAPDVTNGALPGLL